VVKPVEIGANDFHINLASTTTRNKKDGATDVKELSPKLNGSIDHKGTGIGGDSLASDKTSFGNITRDNSNTLSLEKVLIPVF